MHGFPRRVTHARAFAFALLVATIAAILPSPSPVEAADPLYPRLGLYGHVNGRGEPLIKANGTLDPLVLDQVGRHHVVVLDASPFTEYRPDALTALRARRSDLVLLGYVQAGYAFPSNEPDSSVNLPTRIYHMVRNTNGFLYAKRGGEFRNANINLAKRNAQGRFVMAEAMADFFVDQVLATNRWDGLFLDRFCNSIAWDQTPLDSVDFVKAGYPTFAAFDVAWMAGTDTLANRLRRRAGNLPVFVGNCASGTKYASFNGWMRENFPFQGGGTWTSNVFGDPGGYLVDQGRFRAPYTGWLTAWPLNSLVPYDAETMRRARMTLATASLGDGLGTINPPNLDFTTGYLGWWYDEYGVDAMSGRASSALGHTGWLGRAQGPYSRMVWVQVGVEDACDQNPGFESSVTTGWTFLTTNGSTVQRDASTAMEGVASARIHVPTVTGGTSAARYRSNGDVFYINDTYSATFWAKASTAGRTLEILPVNGSGVPFQAAATETLGTAWKRCQVQFTGSFGYAFLEFRAGGRVGDVWLDDVHFQRGAPFVWRRDFDRGIVLVNTGIQPLVVKLERPMRRITGNLDPVTNDGTIGDLVTVASGDAAFLLRRVEDLVDAGELPHCEDEARAAGLAWSTVAPNPSGGGDAVRLVLAARAAGRATVVLYDVSGRRVRGLHDGPLDPGAHAFAWDGRDDAGRRVPAGLYFARARSGVGSGVCRSGDVALKKVVRRD